jgi:lipopolysaccharide export system permease protein
MKASGLSMISLFAPGFCVGLLLTLVSAQTSFYIAPWGNRQFELLYTEIAHTKAAAIIKPGTFSEGFFDLVVYAQNSNSKTGELQNVFIYDEKQPDSPITIIARRGRIMTDPLAPGHNALLRLEEGDIHRSGESHTKIKFESYDVRLVEPLQFEERKMTSGSMTLDDLRNSLSQKESLSPDQILNFSTEITKRWSVSTLCLLFSIVAMGLGIQTNRRSQKSNNMIVCIAIIVIYYGLFVTLEGMARSGKMPPQSLWIPHFIFSVFGIWKIYENWD